MKKFLAEFRASWNLIIEYRVMVLIWMLTIVLPLIMLAVWLSIAEKGAVQGYDRSTFISYYLAALVVRNITGMWFIWEMDAAYILTGALLETAGRWWPDLPRPAAHRTCGSSSTSNGRWRARPASGDG